MIKFFWFLPVFVSCHFFQEFLHVLVITHAAEIMFHVFYGLVMSQYIASSARDVHHVLTCFLNDFGDLQLKKIRSNKKRNTTTRRFLDNFKKNYGNPKISGESS